MGENVVLNQAIAHQGTEAGGGGFVFTTSWLEGEILVNNLSFVKDVGVRMSVDGGVKWNDTLASFSGSNTANHTFVGPAEVWRFKTPELNLNDASPVFQFAVFYRNGATGETFWDNNFGQDYRVSKADGSAVEYGESGQPGDPKSAAPWLVQQVPGMAHTSAALPRPESQRNTTGYLGHLAVRWDLYP